jgi:hypothetical protein
MLRRREEKGGPSQGSQLLLSGWRGGVEAGKEELKNID